MSMTTTVRWVPCSDEVEVYYWGPFSIGWVIMARKNEWAAIFGSGSFETRVPGLLTKAQAKDRIEQLFHEWRLQCRRECV